MFKEMLLSAVSSIFTSALRMLLAQFRTINGDEKADDLEIAIKKSFGLLKTVTDKTKTKLDDFPVKMVLNAVD